MSNILKLFQKENQETKPQFEEPCLSCLLTSSTFMTLGGAYLTSGLVFRGAETQTSPLYKVTIRSAGVAITAFGAYRGIEAYKVWQKEGWGGFQ